MRLQGTVAFALALVAMVLPATNRAAQRERPPAMVGNDACRRCHPAIYDSYQRTAMARTSGPAYPPIEGSFRHAPSGVSYRIYRDGQTARLAYDRGGLMPLHGTQELKYFVGSNTRGRTFLFDIDGFLYQAPINYYAAKNAWDMSPGYSTLQAMELNHPVDSTCLFCHASRVRPTRNGTLNGFDGVPYLQNGVGCERCHGAGSEHVNGAGPMINPAKLTGDRRDSVCMRGLVRQALDLWRNAFDKNPQLSAIGVNLGRALCGIGDADGARAALQRVLKHNPDLTIARQALAEVTERGCTPK